MENELNILKKSHLLISRLIAPVTLFAEELIFIDFRPVWLKSQQNVYKQLMVSNCAICMNDCYVENLSVQHNSKHPPVCTRCYSKLFTCPFCRKTLHANILKYANIF